MVCFKNTNCSVFGSEELLSNAGGLWSVILPLSSHKLITRLSRKVRGQRILFGSDTKRQAGLHQFQLPLSNMVSVPRRDHEKEKNRTRIPRLLYAAMSGLPAEIFLAITVVFVGAG